MDISVGDLIRYIVTGAIVLVLATFGMKVWNKQKLEKQIIRELRDLAHPTTSFESLYPDDGRRALFKSMGLLHKIRAELDKEPVEILKEVFHGDDDGALFGKAQTGRNAYIDPQEVIISKGLLRNYQYCRTLGLFSDGENRKALAEGEAPSIATGSSSGAKATIRYIIDPEVSPGYNCTLRTVNYCFKLGHIVNFWIFVGVFSEMRKQVLFHITINLLRVLNCLSHLV